MNYDEWISIAMWIRLNGWVESCVLIVWGEWMWVAVEKGTNPNFGFREVIQNNVLDSACDNVMVIDMKK